jgi:hypothetical protein
MRLVRRGAAFGPDWKAASERHHHTIKNWRRVVSRAHLPEMSLTAPIASSIPLGAARYE